DDALAVGVSQPEIDFLPVSWIDLFARDVVEGQAAPIAPAELAEQRGVKDVKALRRASVDVGERGGPVVLLVVPVVVQRPGRIANKPDRLAVLPLEMPRKVLHGPDTARAIRFDDFQRARFAVQPKIVARYRPFPRACFVGAETQRPAIRTIPKQRNL